MQKITVTLIGLGPISDLHILGYQRGSGDHAVCLGGSALSLAKARK